MTTSHDSGGTVTHLEVTDVTQLEVTGTGDISLCPKNNCGFRCCTFQQGNFIVLYPGELEAAEARGESVAHLNVFMEENGGHRATCVAADTATCDSGYKPLDCQSYPYFPHLGPEGSQLDVLLKGDKCPLDRDEIRPHEKWVGETWQELASGDAAVADWLREVRLVGYSPVED